jgi:hypothetical protein
MDFVAVGSVVVSVKEVSALDLLTHVSHYQGQTLHTNENYYIYLDLLYVFAYFNGYMSELKHQQNLAIM